jgi:DNA repair exonuclease SbcCD ATPase subunit
MNLRSICVIAFGLVLLGIVPTRADEKQLSASRLDALDQAGFFTPAFKQAVHDVVHNREAIAEARTEKQKLDAQIPALQQQAADIEVKAAALRQEVATYEHPEETDFATLQKLMTDPNAKVEEQVALAQAYVWTYPTSPHESEAQQDLQLLQKNIADQQRAKKEAEAARVAAHAKLVQRAQAHDLSLAEWRDFLRDMSQADLVKVIGAPASQTTDYWTYSGSWIQNPTTKQSVGMEINFEAGRVLNVVEKP